jgi:hypothetical protein
LITARGIALAIAGTLAVAAPAAAQSGGSTAPGSGTSSSETTTTTQPSFPTVPGTRAKLKKNGKAIPPADAPPNIQNAIIAANTIRKHPYRYGGGHRSFYDTGYDCSGAVSFLLYGAGLLEAPMPSGPFMSWGSPGKGQWISVFANGGHAYAVIAGLRWDTSAANDPRGSGKGPRWRRLKRSPKGFAVRHIEGY